MHEQDGKLLPEQKPSSFCVTTIAMLKINKLILLYIKEAILLVVCQLRIPLSQRILRYHTKEILLAI